MSQNIGKDCHKILPEIFTEYCQIFSQNIARDFHRILPEIVTEYCQILSQKFIKIFTNIGKDCQQILPKRCSQNGKRFSQKLSQKIARDCYEN